MAIKAALTVRTNIEDMRKFEGALIVHGEAPSHEDEHASLHWSRLNILVVDAVGDGLEAEGLDFILDLGKSFVVGAVVGHVAVFGVEAEEVVPILHDGCVVCLKELFSQAFHGVVLLHTLI